MVKTEKKNLNGGTPSRIGLKFHKDIQDIQIQRIKAGTSTDKVSTEKITNAILRHKSWKDIKEDLIQLEEEELNIFSRK